MDNWFNSYNLQCKLKFVGVQSIGTVRSNRIAGCVLANDKQLKSGERGKFDSRVDTNNNIVVTKWNDNKVVHVISNYKGPLPVENVKRWSVAEKKKVDVPRPASIGEYNSYMGGIDLHDMLVELYRVNIRVRRYYLRIVYHLLDMCVVNSWLLYRRHCEQLNEKTMSLLKFKLEISHALLQCGKVQTPKRGRPLSNTPPSKKKRTFNPRPTNDVRYDETGHWPIRVIKKQRCKNCITCYSTTKCDKCKLHLCYNLKNNCFLNYHKK